MVQLVRMAEEHIDRTWGWLARSAELRAQIDSLDAPTLTGNRQYWRRNFEDKSRADFAIVAEDGSHVGNCGLVSIDIRRKKAELWIYVGEIQGKGFGAKALHLLLAYAFDELKLCRVYLRVLDTNERALGFYLREGFRIEGRARHDTIHAGKSVDSTLLAILSNEHSPAG